VKEGKALNVRIGQLVGLIVFNRPVSLTSEGGFLEVRASRE
jgi:hypothetical protein